MSNEIKFMWWGQVPAKSNYRWSKTAAAKKKWARIKHFEEELGQLALETWLKSRSGRGGMLKLRPPVTVTIEPWNQRQDANNLSKIVLDSLEGICYFNDKDVGCDIKPMQRDKKGGRIYVTVRWGK